MDIIRNNEGSGGGTVGPQGPPGPKGDTGDTGPQGPAGTNGTNGTNGADGAPGATGATGAKGDKGDTGDTGPAGPAPASTGLKFVQVNGGVLVNPATAGFGSAAGSVCEGNDARLSMFPFTMNGFRLTFSSGNPAYAPVALTPSSTNTTAETVTFSADHGWTNGTMVTPFATGGGLTINVFYYIHVVSSTSVSFHTNVADALSGSSPVNLTGNVTTKLRIVGVSNTTIYLSPYTGDQIGLYDGAAWAVSSSAGAEVSAALGTLTSDRPYDVFVYLSSGVLTLELVAWASTTARTTAIVRQNGIWVKSGTTTKRYVGTFTTDSTTTGIQALHKQLLYNEYNQIVLPLGKHAIDANWSFSSPTIRQANANAANQVEICVGNPGVLAEMFIRANAKTATAGGFSTVGIGEDSTTTMMSPSDGGLGKALRFGQVANAEIEWYYFARHFIPIGKHVYSYNEAGDNSSVWTYQGDDANTFRYYGIFGSLAM